MLNDLLVIENNQRFRLNLRFIDSDTKLKQTITVYSNHDHVLRSYIKGVEKVQGKLNVEYTIKANKKEV